MRYHLISIALMIGAAIPASAQQSSQQPERADRRIERLEQEMRSVQRRVFPGATAPTVGPEIDERTMATARPGDPASDASADLASRLDALERQLASLTGQSEENSNQLRQLEQAMARARDAANARLDSLERAAAPPVQPQPVAAAPRQQTPRPAPAEADPASTPSASVDSAEDAYDAGFHLWEQKRYAEAQAALEAVARQYPNHRMASWASNLAGRASLDAGKPAAAAKILLANYQSNPRGERAADSLYFLGEALVKLGKPADACKAYDELQDVYSGTMRDYLKQRLPAARAAAKCR